MINVDKNRADEKVVSDLANLAYDAITHIDALAKELPEYFDNNNEPWIRSIRSLFQLVWNHRTSLENDKIVANNKPTIPLKTDKSKSQQACYCERHPEAIKCKNEGYCENSKTYAEPTDQDNFIPVDERFTDQHEQETFAPIGIGLPVTGEVDPNGISAGAPGAKLDAGKVMMGVVLQGFHRALRHVGQVGTKGAVKYSKFGFLEVDEGKARYTDAMMRHWFKECTGEEFDMVDDQGNLGTEELHAACVAWNALARLEFILMEKEL